MNGLNNLKGACTRLVFDKEGDQEENIQASQADSVQSDQFYYGFAEDNNNQSNEGKLFKFEADLDKEISFFSTFFTSSDTLKSIKDTKQFWLSNKITLPILFTFASRVLSTPVSSAYIERFFSVSGVVCSNRAFNMKDDLIIMKSMLKSNYKTLRDIHEKIEPRDS